MNCLLIRARCGAPVSAMPSACSTNSVPAISRSRADMRCRQALELTPRAAKNRRHSPYVKLLLIDGHYYVYRSFFAIRELSNSRGEPTNAIYGFIKTVRKMVKDVQPDLGAVIWDVGMPKRRVELQPAYKQQRTEMPDLM